jgi:hypothetical protein
MGCQSGIVPGASNTILLGVALALLAWGVLMALAFLDGFGSSISSLTVTAVHVRLMVAIPLFFMCETWIFPLMAAFPRYLVSSDLVPETAMSTLVGDTLRIVRMSDSWLAELIFLLLAFAAPLVETVANIPSRTGSWVLVLHSAGGAVTWAHVWYLGVCLPLFRFLLFRWIWRLGLWSYFLWRVSQLGLQLIPIHSDSVGGLGYLDFVHQQFAPLAAALSAVLAADCAEDIASRLMSFETLYTVIPVIILVTAALFIGPLCVFSPVLWECRIKGANEYMAMASRYVAAFDRKWVRDKNASGESQLGTKDLRSLADLTHSVNVARGMLIIPATPKLLTILAASVILPQLPLLLFKFPLAFVAARLLKSILGF